MPDRLLVDLDADGQATVLSWPGGELLPQKVSRAPLSWPLDAEALEDLRWYLEDYLRAPFGVWEDRGPAVAGKLAWWGEQVFGSVFGVGPARDAYHGARDKGLEVVFRSAEPGLLGLPWELMRDEAGPVTLGAGGISRSLPVAESAGTLGVPGGKLRVLMVISRPGGTQDVEYQMVARPLLERLDAVRGEVDLTVLRPPTFGALGRVLRNAADDGVPFHVVHFDGHGLMPGRAAGGTVVTGADEGVLAFEQPIGGGHLVEASKVAVALAEGKVPVMVLNACQSGAVGKDLEASVATALLKAGCAAVVAMAYSVNTVAAAEFMAAFYESLFTGSTIGQAVTAGRQRLSAHDGRPSPKGDIPLADWLVPVHYLREDVSFPQARTSRPAAAPSFDAALDHIRTAPSGPAATQDPLATVDGLFVGRDDLFYQLETAARLQRVLVLAGPGGTGKTELAKGFARWWRDTGGVDDPRLVLWHSFEPGLASFGLDGVITEIGLAVSGTDFAYLEADQRLVAVKRLLAENRALLVWDNFEAVREMPDPTGTTTSLDDAGCATLKGFLEWVRDHSRSAVIITSRAQEGWLGHVHRIDVGGLNRTEAAQYASHLLASSPAAQARREHRSFGELLEWLHGHPLAMRLTLPRLDTTDPGELLAGLRGATPLTAEQSAGPGRLSSLGACITYSFAHLSGQTRRLLPAVSLFRSVADANLLAVFSTEDGVPGRFAEISGEEWAAMLADATRVGLLTNLGAGMYRVHPALPGYLAAGWQADHPASYAEEQEACESALCAACADLGRWLTEQIKSGDAALAYAIIGLQRRTLGAMLGHALDHRTWDHANNIVQALDAYLDTRGFGGEATAWADRILAATTGPGQDVPTPASPAGRLWLYSTNHQATRQLDAGQPSQAAQAYRRALAYLQAEPETDWTRFNMPVIYHQLGLAAHARGRLDEADEWYRKALTIFEELGERHSMASTYLLLGRTAQARGRLDEADEWYRKALTIFEELGNRPRMASAYHLLGVTTQRAGRLDEADEWYRKALTLDEELGNWLDMANIYHQLGNTAYLRGRLDQAEEWYRRSLTVSEKLGDQLVMAGSYHQLGMAAQARGRLDQAEEWYRRSLTIKQELGDRPGMAGSYHQLGMAAQARGRLDQAEEWYRRSLTIKQELGDRPGVAVSYGQFGLLAEARQQPGQALAWMIRCVTLFDQFPHPAERSGPPHLARLTRQLGMTALEQAWRRVTGQALPQAVRDYVTSHHEQERK